MGQIFDGSPVQLRKYMEENGYIYYTKVKIDEIYVKKDMNIEPLKNKKEPTKNKHQQITTTKITLPEEEERLSWQQLMLSILILITLLGILIRRFCNRHTWLIVKSCFNQ
jgi:hypothetical protein